MRLEAERPPGARDRRLRQAGGPGRSGSGSRTSPINGLLPSSTPTAAGQAALDPDKLVFLDETWAAPDTARTHGRCPAGERLDAAVPFGHRKAATLTAALRSTGLTAPMAMDGATTGDLFVADGVQVLVPTLRPGDVVVADNLACHKRSEARESIEAAGCELRFLPPDSPDLNPIGRALSKLKALPRKAAKRTVEELWEYLGEVLDEFKPQGCRNSFASCGYPAATPPRETP